MFSHDRHVRQRNWVKMLMLVIPVVLVFMFGSFFAVNEWYKDNLRAVTDTHTEDVVVVVEEGASVREIADQLKDLGVVRNSTVFSWYVKWLDGASELQAGTYRFNSGQSVEQVVGALTTGDVATNLFTILPAQRLDEIEQALIDFGFTSEEVSRAINRRYDHPLFADLPTNATIEGYIFPDTYEVTADSTVEQVLTTSFNAFDKNLTDEIRTSIKQQGLSLHEAITLASIVEKESGNTVDQPIIAQVFLSRLEQGMILGSDVTFFYAAAVTGQAPAVELDNPYNTRVYGGLPPGPIGNFNFSALSAVANPSDSDYLFFVAGDDGITYFAETNEKHEANVSEYCIEGCKLP